MISLFFRNIYQFYRYDCCWPYAVSFLLVLLIYWLDFFIVNTRYHYASLAGYGIIFVYYLYNVILYTKIKIKTKNLKFSIKFLSFKIIIWGLVLIFLYTSEAIATIALANEPKSASSVDRIIFILQYDETKSVNIKIEEKIKLDGLKEINLDYVRHTERKPAFSMVAIRMRNTGRIT